MKSDDWLETMAAPEFVRCVWAWRDGTTSTSDVISRLEYLERKHGVELVVPGLPYRVIEGRLRCRGNPRFEHLEGPSDEVLEQLFRERLFPFLSDTWALVLTAYPDDSDVILDGRYFFAGTARARSQMAAEWANGIEWCGRSNWTYPDFLYGQSFHGCFYEWIGALLQFGRERTKRAAESY